jgi:concanavalin A-like lectin/glucanase superfamily protein
MANPPSRTNVKLLCHFDGSDGDITTTDSSPQGYTLTRHSPATISTAQSKFGGSSSTAGTPAQDPSCWQASDSADWDFAAGPFTVECWFYPTYTPGTGRETLVSQWSTGSDNAWLFGMVTGDFAFEYSTTGSNNARIGAAWSPTLNTWYHLAADRDASNVLRVYINGVVHASGTVSATFHNAATQLDVGGSVLGWPGMVGYIDEVRVVKGEAVYGGAFTPPTGPFTIDGFLTMIASGGGIGSGAAAYLPTGITPMGTTASGDIILPSLQLIAGIIPATTGDGAISLPLPGLSASAGGIRLPALTLNGSGLSGTATAPSLLVGEMLLPSLQLAATALAVTAGQGDITLPALTLEVYDGNRGAIRLPRLTLAAIAESASIGNGKLTLPPFSVAATGYSDTDASAAIRLPQFRLTATGIVGTTGNLRPLQFRFALAATGISGSNGNASITLPSLTLGANAQTSSDGAAQIILPMFYLAGMSLAPVTSLPIIAAAPLNALVLETSATRLTTYSHFAFNSLAEFNGVALGANADGIYQLGGDADDIDDIVATAEFGVSDFRTAYLKRLPDAYVGYRAGGELTLTVRIDEDNEYHYTLLPRKAVGLHPARVKLGRGAKGRYFQLALQNRAGADFELDQLALTADALSRKLG